MADFVMCEDCSREYQDPADRRFHAQPISCPRCGPKFILADRLGAELGGDPISVAAELIRGGQIVAIKEIGGYHLSVDATDEEAVARLRARKYREDKPFAVIVNDLDSARVLAEWILRRKSYCSALGVRSCCCTGKSTLTSQIWQIRWRLWESRRWGDAAVYSDPSSDLRADRRSDGSYQR